MQRVNGVSCSLKNTSEKLEYYTVYTNCDIEYTGRIKDFSQKNFEILLQSISLRASPEKISMPVKVKDVSLYGADKIAGPGYIWKFGISIKDAYLDGKSCVGLLYNEMEGIILYDGTMVNTTGHKRNIEFKKA